MIDKKSNGSRRKLLKSIATGSGAVVAATSLPDSWVKPVVNSVILPVHAETTISMDMPDETVLSCSITGQQNVQAVNCLFNSQLLYTVTNTGEGALTDTSGGIGAVTGSVGFTAALLVIPDPLEPGQSFDFTINQITTTSCSISGEQIRVSFNSNETTCEFIINVSSITLG